MKEKWVFNPIKDDTEEILQRHKKALGFESDYSDDGIKQK